MEDADTALLRKKFGPKGDAYAWHKMATGVSQIVDRAVGEIFMGTKKDSTQKPKTTMVASNTVSAPDSPARDNKPKEKQPHSPDRKVRVLWTPEERAKILDWVEKRMRGMGMEVPGAGTLNGAYYGLFLSAQENLLPKSRWKSFESRSHVDQAGLSDDLRKRFQQPAALPPERAALAELAQAMDTAMTPPAETSVIHVPIQTGDDTGPAQQPGESAKQTTTTGKEVRVITIDPNAKQKQARVWWKSHELTAVQTLAVNKMKSLGVGTVPTKDDYSGTRMLLEVFNSSQHQMLPKDRWKVLKSRATLESVGLLDNLQTLLRQAPKQTLVEVPSVPPPVPAPPAEATVAPTATGTGPVSPASASPFPPAVAPAKPSELPEDEIMAALQVLGRAIARGLAFEKQATELTEMNGLLMEEVDGLRKRIETLDAAVRGMTKVERKVEAAAKVDLPVVAVLGCRKEQFDQICTKAEERGLKLTLRHYDQDSAPRPISAQWAVSLRWVRHHWEDQVKKSGIPMSQYSFLPHGGVSQAVQMLEIWFGAGEPA